MTLPPEDRDLIARVRKFADRLIERAANIASNPDGGPDDEMSLRITGLEGRDIGEDLHRLANVAAVRAEAAPVVDETELRPSVLAFARLMEAKLRANDHKSGWSGEDFFDLFDRLIEETSELHNALCRHAKRLSWGDSWVMEDTKAWVGEEAADVANFAMMIADVCAALEAEKTGGEP